jgi:hypothetical protein
MPEIQEILNAVHLMGLSDIQYKAFYAMKGCRTSSQGSHADVCGNCGHVEISYNSCRNRNCPKCQGSRQEEWVESQLERLLPVGYFHIVFTLPHELNAIVYQNQSLLYSILMKTAGDTILELAKSPGHLGAVPDITAVLHTWGQNLHFHPHVHCIVSGGGLSNDGLRFVYSGKKFFIPVKVLSRKFRGKFLYYLRKAWFNGLISLKGKALELTAGNNFGDLPGQLYAKEWVVFCKKPFKAPVHVVRYLGRYTHRVAISNSRIVSFDGQKVVFRWKDYRDSNREKQMSLTAEEFARRFLQHVLPHHFVKMRHYGVFSNRMIGARFLLCMKLAGSCFLPVVKKKKREIPCPVCGTGIMAFSGVIPAPAFTGP